MSPRDEFASIGNLITGSQQLELDFKDQQILIHEMQETSKELASSPLVVPTLKEVKFGRIAILGKDGQRSTTDKLYVLYSEAYDGRHNSTIHLMEQRAHTKFQLSPTKDEWEVWPHGSKTMTQRLSNEQLVNVIHPRLRNSDILGPLMDSIEYESMLIPHMLASALEKSATRKEQLLRYVIADPMVQILDGPILDINNASDGSFVASAATDFSVYKNNSRSIHKISTKAPVNIGKTTLEKQYTYEAETSPAKFYGAQGLVKVSSADGYTEQQLNDFAAADQFDMKNEPLYSLHRALANVRKDFGLPEETAA